MSILDRPKHMSLLDWLVHTFGNVEGVSDDLTNLNSIPTIKLLQSIKSELEKTIADLHQIPVSELLEELELKLNLKIEGIELGLLDEIDRAKESERLLELKISEQSYSVSEELKSLKDRVRILEDKIKHLEWIL